MSLLASSNTTNIPNNKKRKEPSSSNHHQQQDNSSKRVKRSINGNSSPLHHSRHQHHDSQDELNFSSTMDDYDNKGDEEMSLSQYSSSTTGGGHDNDNNVSQGGGDYSQSQSQPSESVHHDESFIQSQPIISQTQPTTTTALNTKNPPKSSTNHHQNGSSTSHTNNNNNNNNKKKSSSSSNSSNGHHQSRKAPTVSSLDFDDDTAEETKTTTDHEMDFASQDDAPPVVTKNQKTNNNNNKQNGRSHSSTSNNKQSNGSLTAQQQERRQIIKQKELKAEKLAEEERERLLRTQMGDEALNRELYDHFNALQAVASQHKISLKLPELVVVGMQSDGKSSFVEALLGFQFNHVDTNIGTRRPLMLQMHHDPSRTKPYCVFQNEQQQQNGGGSSNQQQQQAIHMDKPTPVHMLEHEIRRRTEQVCGEKGVSPVPICLHVYYKYCANLVIIDTPGFRKGDSDELSAKIEKMVMNLLKPQERIIVCLEQSTVEWCNTQVRPMIQRVDPNFSRTVFVCTKFNNRNNQFRDKEEVDKFLSTDGEVNNPKSVFFISLPSGHNARDLSEEEFKNKILEVYLQDYRHLSNIGFNQEKYKSQLGFYNLRRYLELMLNEKYKAALIPVLERIDHQIKKRQSLVDIKNQELIEAQNVDVEQKANQLLTNFVNLVVKCLNGTNMFPTSKNGQTLEEEREKAAVPWPNYSLDFKIRNSQYKLYGGAQLERLLAEFEVVAHSQEFPATSDDEVAVTIGLNSIHTMPDYDRGASELAQKKSKIVFQPLIDVLLARSRSIMRSMIVMVCGHLFHDNKQFKRVLQEMRNASDQFFDIVINDAKEKCELEFDTFTRVMDWELMGFGTSKQAHEYDLLNPTKEDTIKRVQNLTDDTVAEKMLLFTNDRSRELTEERCRKIKEAAARLFGGVRVLFVKYVRAKYLSFFLQPIFNKLEDHCRTYFHKLGANRVIELADGPNPALIQQTIQQNKTAIESLVEQREKSLKLYNKFKTASGKSSNREAL